MKTLENQTLLYDEDCPLCRVYTGGFIKAKMLDPNGRMPYSSLPDDSEFVDLQRAANEIALIDNHTQTVTYGIDSLLKVIGNSFPWIATIGNWPPVHYILRKLYSFISYNRKVIIPAAVATSKGGCIPDFNRTYRMLFILFGGLFTSIVLWKFAELMPVPKGGFVREMFLAFGQLVFQGIFLLQKNSNTTVNYFGNLIAVSIMGALLLLPLLLLHSFFRLPEFIILGWFGCTVLVMFAEHYRRVRLLELPSYLCYTWVLYRLLALFCILKFTS